MTRFIKEFKLEQEVMAFQHQANSLLKKVNKFIDGSPIEKLDNFGGNVGQNGKFYVYCFNIDSLYLADEF